MAGQTGTEYQRERRSQGLCCSCSNQALPGKSRCQICTDKASERSKAQYKLRKANKQCVTTGCKNKASTDSVYCEECLTAQQIRQTQAAEALKRHRDKEARRQKSKRKAAGVCLGCEAAELFKGGRCRKCFAKKLESGGETRYEARKAAGLCGYCDNLADGPRCESCRAKRNTERQQRVRDRICADCGQQPAREGKTTCADCSKIKSDLYAQRKASGLCPHCGSSDVEVVGKHCKRCQEINQKKDRKKYKKLSDQVVEAYGGKCQCCGETGRAFLQIDHIDNDGHIHRRSLTGKQAGSTYRVYAWLRKNNFPKDKFQLLCANCNYAKARYGICPHQKPK